MEITKKKIQLHRRLFKTRADVYARYWTDFSSGKSGYAPVYNIKRDALTDKVIGDHLTGKKIIGVYPLFPDNTSSFLAIDFDKQNWFDEASSVVKACKTKNVPAYLEKSKSGNGGHVWFFLLNKY